MSVLRTLPLAIAGGGLTGKYGRGHAAGGGTLCHLPRCLNLNNAVMQHAELANCTVLLAPAPCKSRSQNG